MRPRRLHALRHEKDAFVHRIAEEYSHEGTQDISTNRGTYWLIDGYSTHHGEAEMYDSRGDGGGAEWFCFVS